MIIAVDFDGTVVRRRRRSSELELMPDVEMGLAALKAAGHTLVLVSSRANLARRKNATLNPLFIRRGSASDSANEDRDRHLAEKRYQNMLTFVAERIPDMFDAIDDGGQGKVEADLYIDNRAVNFCSVGSGPSSMDWADIGETYGDPDAVADMYEESEKCP